MVQTLLCSLRVHVVATLLPLLMSQQIRALTIHASAVREDAAAQCTVSEYDLPVGVQLGCRLPVSTSQWLCCCVLAKTLLQPAAVMRGTAFDAAEARMLSRPSCALCEVFDRLHVRRLSGPHDLL